MRRSLPFLIAGAAALLVAACRDSAVAPREESSVREASPEALSLSKSGNGKPTSAIIGTLQISPEGGTYHVGAFDIVIPAGAVCDPASSSYGPKHWDEDCAPAASPVTVNVVAEQHKDRVSVDFQPDLRFRPSAGWVTIQTTNFRDVLHSSTVRQLPSSAAFFQTLAILYAPSHGQSRVDEVRTLHDRSLATHVEREAGLVWRRVKHFSGYQVSLGFTCSVADSSCATPGIASSLSMTDTSSLSPLSVVVTP